VAATGVAGYLLMRFGQRVMGLVVTCVFAGLGFNGLLHYRLAPLSAHSLAMNVTILTEVALAFLLVCAVVAALMRAIGPAAHRRP
jgi:hypothetical protein